MHHLLDKLCELPRQKTTQNPAKNKQITTTYDENDETLEVSKNGSREVKNGLKMKVWGSKEEWVIVLYSKMKYKEGIDERMVWKYIFKLEININ